MVDKEPLKKYDMIVSRDYCDMVELNDIKWRLRYGRVLRDECDVVDKENATWQKCLEAIELNDEWWWFILVIGFIPHASG